MIKVGRYILMGLLIWYAIDMAGMLGTHHGIITSATFTVKLIEFLYIFAVYMITTAVNMFIESNKE